MRHGVPVGLAVALGSHPAAIDRPSRFVAQGLAYDLITVLAITLAVGAAFGLATGAGPGSALAGGLAGGPVARAGSPWPRYAVTVHALRRRGSLPARPSAFIDWAYAAGLLRLSGTAVQLRHHELQAWLTAPRSGGLPPRER